MTEPEPAHDDHKPEIYGRNARVGLLLFFVYLFFYAGFVYLNAYQRETMGQLYGGLNLALWYGFGLIAGAFVMSLLYMFLCRKRQA